ncbi:MAG: thioredoxin family protein [Caldilineaceae bacterium]|nr:thioredoxin family protein [Caldilineaceae bacterium]
MRKFPCGLFAVTALMVLVILTAGLLASGAVTPAYAQSVGDASLWDAPDEAGNAELRLYFFWSLRCPHCREAHPFVSELSSTFPWLVVEDREISTSTDNARLYEQLAAEVGERAQYVPAFLFCGQMIVGYDHADTTGAQLVEALSACQAQTQARYDAMRAPPVALDVEEAAHAALAEPANAGAPAAADPPIATVTLPLLGAVALANVSLPLFTVIVAGMDAFNPCAFFVLMFLLSLLVHTHSRRRMLLIGGLFVLVSGLLYFVFMGALLNVFLWAGELRGVTLVAGLLAVGMALLNIKDFFWFKQGPSLSIPEGAKPGLFQRMRTIVQTGRLPAMLASTVLLAIAANSYELLCTSGFPMIYTRALTLHQLPQSAFYGYLALYNLVYVLPLLIIVAVFAQRLGARKLTEREGRALKLLSGTMMGLLGILLIVAPDRLGNPVVAILLMAAAVGVTWLGVKLYPADDAERPLHGKTNSHPETRQGAKPTKHIGRRGAGSAAHRPRAKAHPR